MSTTTSDLANDARAMAGFVRAVGRAAGRVGAAVHWHPWLTAGTVTTVAVMLTRGPRAWLVAVLTLAVVVVVWRAAYPVSFAIHIWARWRASWRREWVYRRRWRKTMFLHHLAVRFDGREVIPALRRVRCGPVSDVVAVRIPEGQATVDWSNRADSLAESFGALECRVQHPKTHWVHLEFILRRDIPPVPALPIPDTPDLRALAIGRCADGRPWLLSLADTAVLVVGVLGSGKGSVLWSIIRALAGGVRRGVVQLWVADPKGGMEFGHGPRYDNGRPSCPMFSRFARTPAEIADMFDAAVALLIERATHLSGQTRRHVPTPDDPTIVIVVDELLALTRFDGTDTERNRIQAALGLLISEGRAVGVHVICATQDPRKSSVKVRDLIPTRIGLRMVDADHVDAGLGQVAWARGARCEDIPASAPGCGWVFVDGQTEPTWVRASWISDDDIAHMARDYPARDRVAWRHLAHALATPTPWSARRRAELAATATARDRVTAA